MIQQVAFKLKPQSHGFHLITDEVLRHLPQLPKTGLLNLFVQHTSCALSICENWDPDVRDDMETIYDRLVPENMPDYRHVLEGSDDMPAHAKCIITGVSIIRADNEYCLWHEPCLWIKVLHILLIFLILKLLL